MVQRNKKKQRKEKVKKLIPVRHPMEWTVVLRENNLTLIDLAGKMYVRAPFILMCQAQSLETIESLTVTKLFLRDTASI